MSSSGEFQLEGLEVLSLAEQMKLFADSFQRPVDEKWYRWKHVEGPWGPSIGIVAVDKEGPAAMLLGLPWQVRAGISVSIVNRGVDSGTLPRAQHRGLFQAMVQKWVADERAAGKPFTFCSVTEASARAQAKVGATVLAFSHAFAIPYTSSVGVSRFASVPVAQGVTHYEAANSSTEPLIATCWQTDSLLWRFDQRSGLEYNGALLREPGASAGLIYRLESRSKLKTLIRVFCWGNHKQRDRLTASVARSHLCPVVLDLESRLRPPRHRRGSSLMCTWSHHSGSSLKPTELSGWDLTIGDLEGVI